MENVQASEQLTRYQPADVSGSSTPHPAFEPNPNHVIYDLSGAREYILRDETLVIQCQACQKTFTTKQSLERHKDRFPLCKDWKKGNEPVLSESVYIWAQKKIDGALSSVDNCKTCQFCEKEFSSVGNFHKHFESATVCNRLGMREIKKVFAEPK